MPIGPQVHSRQREHAATEPLARAHDGSRPREIVAGVLATYSQSSVVGRSGPSLRRMSHSAGRSQPGDVFRSVAIVSSSTGGPLLCRQLDRELGDIGPSKAIVRRRRDPTPAVGR
jgi:hypothetical protein